MAGAARLSMSGISKRFGATTALERVALQVSPGEIHALVGENGAGKSTLMKILAGAETPDAGEIRLDGDTFRPRDPLEARRRGVAMIYQELSLAPHLTVEENVSLGRESSVLGVVRRKEARMRARAALEQLGHGDFSLDAPVRALPVAARQIVEIARALAGGCRIMVLDEPTSSLAAADTRRLFSLLRRLKQQGMAVVYISHFLDEIKEISDRVTVLRDGRNAGGGDVADISPADIVRMMIGRRLDELYPRSRKTPGETILEVNGLAGTDKVKSADIVLRRGEVLGIAGLVGAGRTELLRLLFSLDKVRRGEIRIGAFSGPASPPERLEQGMGLLSEDRKGEGLALDLSVADNLTMSKLRGLGPGFFIIPGRQDTAAGKWIQRLDIRCAGPRQSISNLSGGNQQKVALARLLHHDVDVLLLDEPTRGIDVASKTEIYALIDRLAAGGPGDGTRPKAVLIVSSYLPELLGICDRIAVMSRGVLQPAKDAWEWTEQGLLLAATGQETQ